MRSLTFAALALPAFPAAAQKPPPFHPTPMDGCTDPGFGPVLAGVDFVDLQELRAEQGEAPQFGTETFAAKLNNYTFWFKTATNQAKFAADPWRYAPIFGGFGSYAVWMSSSDNTSDVGDCRVGVDIHADHSYNVIDLGQYRPGQENHTFMQRGSGPANKFGAAMPQSAMIALQNWKHCYGAEQDKWPFNTKCCGKANRKAGPPNDYVCDRPAAVTV